MLIVVVAWTSTVEAQDAPASEPASAPSEPAAKTEKDGIGELEFAFERAPWREVINWLANASDLALHVGDLPTGSFTYSDPGSFTPQEALDRVNLFLLPQGFTLVRSGKLLSVINLSDPRSMQQLDALAKLVTVEQLDQLESHDVVKCIFPLGELDAEDAVEELTALKLMSTPAVFSKTNQLMITDTAGKLKNVKTILSAFEPDALDNGTVVKNFALEHVDAEDVLVVARPHLGLATGEMIGIDVSLSADLQGKNIFVTGIEDKVKLIEGLIAAIDKPTKSLSPTDGESELRSHIVAGGNVEVVYNVLQTLLAGKSVRLSMDETAGSIVALASTEIQEEIAQTVSQLQASEAEFAVIPLKTIDPYFAVSLLEEMLDLDDLKSRASAGMEAFTRHGNSRGLDLNLSLDLDVPRIDADPGNMRLFVRAKKHQMEQIKKIVAELDAGSADRSDEIRLLPLRGKQVEQVLKTAAKFWRETNPIFFYPSTEMTESEEVERVVAPGESTNPKPAVAPTEPISSTARLLTNNPQSQEPAIRCQVTPRGLLLQSEDTKALDQFEELLRTITGPGDSMPSPPIVFYLKYTKADEAIRMLAELLDGGEAAKEGEAGSLVNGYVSGSAGTFLGSIVTSRDGTMTMIAGSITVVVDSRLNRLIAQGTASDIERIEGYLKIVDKDNSITSIETYGTSHVIELVHARASEVATAIREAYAGRVSGGAAGAGQASQPGAPQQPGQREAAAEKKAGADKKSGKEQPAKKGGASQAGRNLEPKMTVAVHERSNSLIVTAPEQLFQEVEQLAKLIDTRSQQTVRFIRVPDGVAVDSLRQAFSGGTRVSRGATSSPARSKKSN